MAEGVGFVPKFAIFRAKFTHFHTRFNYNPTLFGLNPTIQFTDSFTDSESKFADGIGSVFFEDGSSGTVYCFKRKKRLFGGGELVTVLLKIGPRYLPQAGVARLTLV